MNDSPLQVALRELRRRMADPVTIGILAAIAVVLVLSGPFNTLQMMRLPERLAYWGVVTPLTFAAGLFGSALAAEWGARRGWSPAWRLAGRTLGAAGLVIAALVLVMVIFGYGLPARDGLVLSMLSVLAICLALEVIEMLAGAQAGRPRAEAPAPAPDRPDQAPPAPDGPGPAGALPPLLARLPLDRRGDLVALSAVDHYVEVRTSRGRHLLLMRIGDAMAETAPTAGLQIHRSHWVALDQVRKATRRGDGAEVTLPDGEVLPVARSRLAALRACGLLPKGG